MGERERVAALSLPVARGDVGERSAPRPLRRKPNSSPERPHRQKSKSPPAQPHGRAREGRTLSHPVPEGGRGAERPTPFSSETESSIRTVKPAPSEIQIPASTAPRESARGSHPLAPRPPPRGCRGAERPTPVSSETEFSTRTVKPAPLEIQIPASTAPGERERV